MQLILYAAIIAGTLVFIFFTIRRALPKQSLFRDTMDIIDEIMREPDDSEENDDERGTE